LKNKAKSFENPRRKKNQEKERRQNGNSAKDRKKIVSPYGHNKDVLSVDMCWHNYSIDNVPALTPQNTAAQLFIIICLLFLSTSLSLAGNNKQGSSLALEMHNTSATTKT